LPSAIEGLGKSTYVVDKPIKVLSGRVAPAYLQPGGGTQYIMPYDLDILLESGSLREVIQ